MGKNLKIIALAATTSVIAAEASASGFMLREGSSTALGTALAGRTSGFSDVSLINHNPASLRGVRGFEVSAGVAGVLSQREATVQGAAAPGAKMSEEMIDPAAIPSLAAAYRFNKRVAVGVVFNSTFGAITKYSDNFMASADGTNTELKLYNLTPMIAIDPVPGFTIAGGVTIQYADATFNSQINYHPSFGTVDWPVGISGDGVRFGIVLGTLFDVTESTTVGVTYKQGFDHELDGDIKTVGLPFPSSGGTARFRLPHVVSVGVTHAFTDDFRMMVEGEWAGWGNFDVIRFKRDDGLTNSPSDDVQNYDNSWMIAIGAEYDVNDSLTVRGGVGFDKSPTRDSTRSQRIPDGDRIMAALGLSYDITENFGLDAAYVYINMDDTTATAKNTGRALKLDGDTHLLSVNMRYRF